MYHDLLFFFNDTATTEIYTLSLHDALPIYPIRRIQNAEDQAEHGRREDPREDRAARAASRQCNGDEQAAESDHGDRKSTRLNSSHANISYAVFCLKKKKQITQVVPYVDCMT